MPLEHYGVLKGSVVEARREEDTDTPHYQVHVNADGTSYRIAVNVKSQMSPSELLFLVDDRFQHPLTAGLPGLPHGFTELQREPGSLALDFIRGNLFDRLRLRPLPPNLPGPDNDLSDRVEHYVARASQEDDSEVYAGERGAGGGQAGQDLRVPPRERDPRHPHEPGQRRAPRTTTAFGRMAHSSSASSTDQWVALFLAFQSQAWHTDDNTGHAITEPGHVPGPAEPDRVVRIVGALVNPIGPAPEAESITLLNASPEPVELAAWEIADRLKNKQSLTGTIAAGDTLTVPVQPPVQLGNRGGIITLLDDQGLKVDGVAYTEQQAQPEGWTLVF